MKSELGEAMEFDKAYVISLVESTTRREQFFKYCNRIALSVTWFQAIYGRSLNYQELRENGLVAQNLSDEKIKAGTLGTMLSHVGVWDEFLASTGDVALVFEDDTILPRGFLKNLRKINLGQYADTWDMLYLGGNKINCISEDGVLGVPIQDGVGNTGQYGYVIHRRAVEKLKKIVLPYTGVPHDIVMRDNFDAFNALFLMKPIVDVHRFRFPSVRKDANHKTDVTNLSLGAKFVRWMRG